MYWKLTLVFEIAPGEAPTPHELAVLSDRVDASVVVSSDESTAVFARLVADEPAFSTAADHAKAMYDQITAASRLRDRHRRLTVEKLTEDEYYRRRASVTNLVQDEMPVGPGDFIAF